jgi:molecular chaperone DnaK (HSP70)
MRLGIDFGTTHTVAALVDRGNYPVVPFGEHDTIPSLLAAHEDGRVVYGVAAARVLGEPGWTLLRSIKRLLHGAGPETEVRIGARAFALSELLAGFLGTVRDSLREQAGARAAEQLVAAVSVPANASSGQRLLTVDAFRAAGIEVLRLLNEPSAAALEYGHRFTSSVSSRREHVLIYDLGGGTFDASVLRLDPQGGEVIGTAGIASLGGDDFDAAILELALSRAEVAEGSLSPTQRAQLLDECRLQKEAVNPSTRKLVIDLAPVGRTPLTLRADEVFAACAPLVEQSLSAMDEALRDAHDGAGIEASALAGIYVVGGQSSFPPVYRRLRERFGQHRVRRSPHPFGSIAIGLAIQLAEGEHNPIAEKLTRHFGVFREASAGREVAVDVLLAKDTRLPVAGEGPLEVTRRYRAAHNIGHFRYFECARIRGGRPEGNLALWDDLRFPFDPRLRAREDLAGVAIERISDGPEVEERVRCSASGEVEVELRVLADGFARKARIAPRAAAARGT